MTNPRIVIANMERMAVEAQRIATWLQIRQILQYKNKKGLEK